MGNGWPPCTTEDSCLAQPLGVNLLIYFATLSFLAPCALGGYRRFFTEGGRKLAAKKKREKDARKDSRKISIEVGQPKR